MPSIIKFVLMSPKKQDVAPYTGVYVRGFLLGLLKGSSIGDKYHNVEDVRRYAVKPLYPLDQKKTIRRGRWIIGEYQKLAFEVGLIDPETESEALALIIRNTPQTIIIENAELELLNIEIKRVTLEELPEKRSLNLFSLEFKTPTAFAGGKRPYLFPEPQKLFSSILRVWNRYAPEQAKIDKNKFLEWINNNVYVRNYKLTTREVIIKEKPIVGFKGKTTFLLLENNPEKTEKIIALLKLAQISNIGIKGTYGMGAIKVMDPTTKQQIEI